jgi:hypothetical protein
MRYLQRYEYYEYIAGYQKITFIVSDNYQELYEGDYTETDIFVLGSVKQELNLDEGSFAVDELPFSINHLACRSTSDEEAMYFVLESASTKINRYCAVFFGEETTLANLVFSGKINNNISGEDLLWAGDEYATAVNPMRDYSFTAYSFDVSILEKCKFTKNIYDSENNKINNIYEQFENEAWSSIINIFEWRDSYITKLPSDESPWDTYLYKITPLANLYDVLRVYFDKSEAIIEELINTEVNFNITPSSFGIKSSPIKYEFGSGVFDNDLANTRTSNLAVELELTPNFNTGKSPVYIQRKLINPDFNPLVTGASENTLSFKDIDNMADLLYAIARAFACYVIFTYTTNTVFNVEFKSRSSLIESEYTLIIGAEQASFDTNSIAAEGIEQFKGQSTIISIDGHDFARNKIGSNDYEDSQNFADLKTKEKSDKDKYNITYKQLLFTTSSIIRHIRLNATRAFSLALNTTRNPNSYWSESHFVSQLENIYNEELLFNGIYVKINAIDQRDIDLLGDDYKVWRPVVKVYSNVDGANEEFNTLTEFVNAVCSKDSEYYKTEYELTVPFWNGFKKAGGSASWNNIKLGSKIQLSEVVKTYDSDTGDFTPNTITKDYSVVGIERNLSKPETKLKLHNLSRFAYGEYTGTPVEEQNEIEETPIYAGENFSNYELEDGATVSVGDAVMLLDSGKIARSIPNSDYLNKTIGICVNIIDDVYIVQKAGEVFCEYYDFDITKELVFVNETGNVSPPFNVSQTPIETPTYNYNTFIVLGKVLTANTFLLNIKEYCFEESIYQN